MSSAAVLATRFPAFGPQHFALIGSCLLGCAAMVLVARRLRHVQGGDARFRRTFALLIPIFTLPLQIQQLLPSDFGLGTSLPLQVCDLSWMLAVYALWTARPWATSLLYFWGLTLVPQAILTPSLGQLFPDPRYFMFWGMHFLTVWAAVYLVAAGHRPDWKGYRTAVLVTGAWAASVMVLNAAIGTNYGYLNGKSSAKTALDILGPWPLYVVNEIVIVAVVWALMTLPWLRHPTVEFHRPSGETRAL